jgi:hypothetical protein
MDANLATKALNCITVNSVLTKRALDELSVHRSSQQKAASMRSALLDQMLEVGCVAGHQKQAADAMLCSHAETLGLLKMAVDKIAKLQAQIQKTAGDLGQGVDEGEATGTEKVAGDYNSLDDGYVGRKTSRRKVSDEAILRVMQPAR